MHLRGRATPVGTLLAAALLIGGCSSDDDPEAGPEPSGTAAPGSVTCQDETGDSNDTGLDLTAVRLARSDGGVRVVIEESALPPDDDPAAWVVGFLSSDGKDAVELTITKRKNGDLAHAIVVNGKVRAIGSPVRVAPSGVSALFPVEPIDDLGTGARWYASLSVDGSDVDFCPGGAELREVLDITPLELPTRW